MLKRQMMWNFLPAMHCVEDYLLIGTGQLWFSFFLQLFLEWDIALNTMPYILRFIMPFIGQFLLNLGSSWLYKGDIFFFMCIKPTRLLHKSVRWHMILQSWRKCTAATKSVGPYQEVGGTSPKDVDWMPNM